mmetsp:Transcript_11328/g.15421  ORF Transcript_11328/g.15421 Transcript_11328/m.15421 type:complete len:177 (+) Transcript_11328:143-673(+)|eukprot:CAMPEP_0196571072 /NCGR_PEP_ID=MMETSP1081-20130531/1238_1 /TAXON_ID=36882 /ORGANISM="Pyramimonas amylifera, Strain CCMP720" /LENGTH=176 /DNA_ID=CAMNT_0041887835 /DNA_START=78 /DNA_END=608 /DNA_ORIENTATION=-
MTSIQMLSAGSMVALMFLLAALIPNVPCALSQLGPDMVYGDDPRKPVEVNDELLCEGCHAIFDVVEKKIGGKKRTEDAIYGAMDNICNQENFRVYKMIPPTMKKGCEAFIDRYGEGIEEKMYKLGAEEAEKKVCKKVCKGQPEFEKPPPINSGAQTPPPKKKKKKSKKAKKAKEEF